MHRIGCILPGAYMASHGAASIGLNIQTEIIVDVAGSAGYAGVAVGEREAECRVVKFPIGPFCDGMALRAGCSAVRKSCLDVIRNISAQCGSFIPIAEMAAHAVG
jgi:hypothetical protein